MDEKQTNKISKEVAEKLRAFLASGEVKAQLETLATKADAKPKPDFEVVISSETRDRHGEVISQTGIKTANYMKSPVVLYGHISSTWDLREGIPIVGVTDEIIKDPETKQTIARGRFIPKGISDIADQVRALYEAGMPMPTSVGVRVKEYDVENDTITECELLEWSFVVIPANPDAIAVAKSAGVDIKRLVEAGVLAKGFMDGIKEGEPQENEPKEDENTSQDEPQEPEQDETTENAETPEEEEKDASESENEDEGGEETAENDENNEENPEPDAGAEEKTAEKTADKTKTLTEEVGAELAKMQSGITEVMTASARRIVELVRAEEQPEGEDDTGKTAATVTASILTAQLNGTIESLKGVAATLAQSQGDGGAEEPDNGGGSKGRSKHAEGELEAHLKGVDLQATLKAIANGASEALGQINRAKKQRK